MPGRARLLRGLSLSSGSDLVKKRMAVQNCVWSMTGEEVRNQERRPAAGSVGKGAAAKPEDLISIPESHMMEED